MKCKQSLLSLYIAIAAVALVLFPTLAPAAANISETLTTASKARYQELISKARAAGKVRVIIGFQLNAPYQLDARLRGASIKAQRDDIVDAQEKLLNKFQKHRNARTTKKFKYIPYMALEVDSIDLEVLYADPNIIVIEEDILASPGLQNSVPQVGANNVWNSGYTGSGQTIAILDTGIDKNHNFLIGKVVSEACYSSNLCPNGQTSQIGPGAGVNCTTNAGCYHGTHVAGIAAGKGGSFSGVAKDANLISIQVFSNVNNYLGANISDMISGLERVYQLRSTYAIAAVNLSITFQTFSAYCDDRFSVMALAISNLQSYGIPTVTISGNDGATNAISFPGCISKAIAVGSVSKTDVVSNFSNSASFLSLLAPGDSINSSVPGGGFLAYGGTSMAAPHVAGAWALLKSKWPYAPFSEVLNSLQVTGKPVTDSRNGLTKPRIQVDQAMQNLDNWMLSDSDGDGMLNKDELAVGRNPYVNEVVVVTIINSVLLLDN